MIGGYYAKAVSSHLLGMYIPIRHGGSAQIGSHQIGFVQIGFDQMGSVQIGLDQIDGSSWIVSPPVIPEVNIISERLHRIYQKDRDGAIDRISSRKRR